MSYACKTFFAIGSCGVLLTMVYIHITGVKWTEIEYHSIMAKCESKEIINECVKGKLHIKLYFGYLRLENNPTTKLPYHPSKPQPLEHLDERFQARADVLRSECKRFRNRKSYLQTNKLRLDHIVVNDKYKVLYCFVPKVACTNLKRVFLMLTGKLNVTDPLELNVTDVHFRFNHLLTYLSSFSQKEVDYRVNNYKKVIFVREPLERLLSAYRNKFDKRGGHVFFQQNYAKHIIKRFRKNPSYKSLETGFDLRFPEFIEYITRAKSYLFNEHWDTYNNLCSPCHIKYDFIGKYETLNEDVDVLLKQISVDHMIKFPRRNQTTKTFKTEDTMEEFYGAISPEKIQRLQEIYSRDYSVFGFQRKDSSRRFINTTV